MAHIWEQKPGDGPLLGRVLEKSTYKLCNIDPSEEMSWQKYSFSMLIFSFFSFILVYLTQRLQNVLPMNTQSLQAVPPDLALNTSISFITNTNWQAYSGEATLSCFTQMLALTSQNFLSAAVGMTILIALIRGITKHQSKSIGNFWTDLTRTCIYILLPLSVVLSLLLIWQGSVQTFSSYQSFEPLQKNSQIDYKMALGPVASQVAIKQLGTNGGGFFNVNSCHPFENPTPLSNLLEVVSIILIPVALCFTFGIMVKNIKQGLALLSVMTLIFVMFLALSLFSEFSSNPSLTPFDINQNMEGKETRFGVANSVLWAVTTTAASNGSVNCMHDSLTPLGGLASMVLMQLGEVIYGGVGSGLYGMIVFAIVTVFVAGLMVGRTPEYLGKKIEIFEMKMASLILLIPPFVVLIGTAIALSVPEGKNSIFNPGIHGFSEVLYAFSSAGNNNGSAFAGLNANTHFYNYALGAAMFIARYWLAIPVLAIAGSLAQKKSIPVSSGTIPTTNLLFISFLACIVLIFGALTFIPSLALGPIVEHLYLYDKH